MALELNMSMAVLIFLLKSAVMLTEPHAHKEHAN